MILVSSLKIMCVVIKFGIFVLEESADCVFDLLWCIDVTSVRIYIHMYKYKPLLFIGYLAVVSLYLHGIMECSIKCCVNLTLMRIYWKCVYVMGIEMLDYLYVQSK